MSLSVYDFTSTWLYQYITLSANDFTSIWLCQYTISIWTCVPHRSKHQKLGVVRTLMNHPLLKTCHILSCCCLVVVCCCHVVVMLLSYCRCQPPDWHGQWPHAAGQEWTGQRWVHHITCSGHYTIHVFLDCVIYIHYGTVCNNCFTTTYQFQSHSHSLTQTQSHSHSVSLALNLTHT